MQIPFLIISVLGLLLIGFAGNSMASHDGNWHLMPTASQLSKEKCSLYKDLEKNSNSLQQDIIVKSFFAKYPESITNSSMSFDDSNLPKADVHYKYEKDDITIRLVVYVREVGPNPLDCFIPVYYEYRHKDADNILQVDFYYNQQKQAIETLNSYSITSPYDQLRKGVASSDVTCRLGMEKITKFDGSPACVVFKTKEALIHRGWAKGESSFAGKILEELRKGPQEITQEQNNYVKQIVLLDSRVQELIGGRDYDFHCCAYVSDNNKFPYHHTLSITINIKNSTDQIIVGLDLDTVKVSSVEQGFQRGSGSVISFSKSD